MSRSVLGDVNLSRDVPLLVTKLYDYLRRVDRVLGKREYLGEATWDPPSISDGDSATTTVDVRDAREGDAVIVYPPYDLSGVTCTGYVSADDTVTIVLANSTGGSVDLDSGKWRVRVEKW